MASKRRLRRNGCDTKVRFDSKPKARLASYRALQRTGTAIGYYKCQFCGGWHIGHTGATRLRKRASALIKTQR